MSSTEYFRTFVAITPSGEILDAVQEKVADLKRQLDSREIRWERRDKWHITLRFLGDVPSSEVPALSSALETACAAHGVFSAKAVGVGAFPSLKRPRILWTGIEDQDGALASLQQAVAETSTPFMAKEDEKRFRPHLTIARIKTEHRRILAQVEPAIQPWRNAEFGSWEVDNVELWRSTLETGGSQYELLARFPLRR